MSVLAELLSTKTDMVEKALLYRTVATGRDIIDKQHTEQEASYGRDAFAKVRLNLICGLQPKLNPVRMCSDLPNSGLRVFRN